MPEGLIIKALSGYYYVLSMDQGAVESIQCRARGIFKKKGITPLVGDRVIYELTENGEGTVDEVLPRTSELIRPPVANVELVVLVFSIDEPALNLQLLDKFLVHAENAGLDTIICLTKSDLVEDNTSERQDEVSPSGGELMLPDVVKLYENIGYQVVVTSSKQGEGIEAIFDRLAGSISVFAGQSGVGKSSLLNAMVPGLTLETNAISNKLGRGKHTTRHVELIRLHNGGLVADTPGFSQLDFIEIEVEHLGSCFAEFASYAANCKFRGCLHLHEPECKVIEARDKGEIAPSRYEHYLQFLGEMKDRKRRY
ncbi:ribosome small subunit-dependent GTPase A [Paenibacillus thalictri]|uniref:Small ribosomal subunit biogenesis GTPase RsgA n=1 Tax=Paenibacillus thalictri TaxID=2527873 RepID=A0A4Q9DSU4_9BACL|nr:ribosome small subunit-dependent GTPase A [Paenibacillus thalictri]TBL78339.1 ribosome small subunit-dependent GTPase A [Paenibacillus thalictri]